MIIYKATNLINGKVYVGKTISSLNQRKLEHLNAALKFRYNMIFHNAIRKYSIDNFKWEIIYECDDELILNIMETMKIIVNHSHVSEGKGYNLTWGGEGLSGYKHTEETKKKMSKSHKLIMTNERRKEISEKLKGHSVSQKTKTKLHDFNIGKKLTEEHKRKMSVSHKKYTGELNGFYGKNHTKEAKQKIGNASRKYNDEILSNIKKMLDDGMTRRSIADKICIPYTTINEWIRKYIG
jgi:group I intron endonuclease